ncbi:MAG: hypothetical protein H7258_02290 [Ferruginibacter sp.]|nr:hypothetical protein [Ferruginibacter sp.]
MQAEAELMVEPELMQHTGIFKTTTEETITALRNYVNKRVWELTNGMQVPTTKTDTKAFDWKL